MAQAFQDPEDKPRGNPEFQFVYDTVPVNGLYNIRTVVKGIRSLPFMAARSELLARMFVDGFNTTLEEVAESKEF